jgi:Icc protein
MRIAQITDLHVVARDRLCYRKVPTNEQLAQAVAHLNSLEPRPDVVIASGDLTDHGRAEEYGVLREILAELRIPIFVVPGNHDHRDVMRSELADHRYMAAPGSGFINYASRISRFGSSDSIPASPDIITARCVRSGFDGSTPR